MRSEATIEADFIYTVRRNALEPCLRWQLAADALICGEEGEGQKRVSCRPSRQWARVVPYCEIVEIRLSFDPTRIDTNRYRCALRGSGGIRTSIVSTSYAGFASFEDRGEQYTPFVLDLVRRVRLARPSVRITTGLSWPSYILQHGLLMLALIALVGVLGIAGVPALGSTFVSLAIVILYCGVLWRYARLNLPRDLTLPPLK